MLKASCSAPDIVSRYGDIGRWTLHHEEICGVLRSSSLTYRLHALNSNLKAFRVLYTGGTS